jgi:hypothetical protein
VDKKTEYSRDKTTKMQKMPSYPFQHYELREAHLFTKTFLIKTFKKNMGKSYFTSQVAFAFPLVFTLSPCLSGIIASYMVVEMMFMYLFSP